MGFINWTVQKTLRNTAARVAQEVSTIYEKIKLQNPELTDQGVFFKMIADDSSKLETLSEKSKNIIRTCCQTIEGVSYSFAIIGSEAFGSQMIFRLIQFTKYMDYELYKKGFKKQSREKKEAMLKVLNIYVDNWEECCR